ncbi:DUF6843 domain-containing protein [Paenibacillus spongiae]|uniref:DUF6843 domain-containing protein n=1 Tax=Paenibacillus spongiae TaxID=2909671 RepID=A0ABY5S8V0_9BACL|nr:hypothetical protein [Paenibacillus spongiae]UVI29262.1 hypothetical protein L1F29_28150 [Paenibacillus spongiae]
MKMKWVLGIFAVIVTTCLVIGIGIIFSSISEKSSHKFLLPKDYTGWIEVVFDQPEYSALKHEGNYIVYEVPPSGKIKTSSRNISGPMIYYYVDNNGTKTELTDIVEMIHGLGTSSGGIGYANGTTEEIPEKLRFFVGTKEQWEDIKPR